MSIKNTVLLCSKIVHFYTLTAVDSSTDKSITSIHCKLLCLRWRRLSTLYGVTKNVLQGSRVRSQYISHLFKSSAVFFSFCGSLFWAEIEKRWTRSQSTETMSVLWREKFKLQVETGASSLCLQQNEKQARPCQQRHFLGNAKGGKNLGWENNQWYTKKKIQILFLYTV